jgi:colanic acid/amylovoran biosynthesis glycosyltransferase
MKIAFIVPVFPSLSQTFVLNQITGLLDRGHDVTIYARSPGVDPVVHADVERYGLLDCTSYYRSFYQAIPKNPFLRLVKAVGLVVPNLGKKPVPILRALDVRKFGREAASLRILYQAAPFLDRHMPSYDVVHCHFGTAGNFGALLKDLGAIDGKLVTSFHGFDITRYIRDNGVNAYEPLFRAGDLFLPISERWRRELVKLGCEEQKVVVHRMGVDTSRFFFTPRRPRDDGRVHVLTVARLVEKKGAEYGIRAVMKVLQRCPHLEYKIAGDGPLKGQLRRLINTSNMGDRIQLLGWRRQEEIVKLMQEADLLLAPSVTGQDGDQEGIPVVLMEALAQGLPVLSTCHSGIPELVQEGQSGFLVPERDVDALAEKLEYLVEHPETWPEMGRAGRDYVEAHYDINILNDRLVQLYQRLLDGDVPQ